MRSLPLSCSAVEPGRASGAHLAAELAGGRTTLRPRNAGGAFSRYSGRQRILRPDGRLLLQDYGRISGDELRRGPLGTMAASATALVIAPPGKLPVIDLLMQAVDQSGCLAGASEAP